MKEAIARTKDFVEKLQELRKSDISLLKRNAGRSLSESQNALSIFYRIVPYGLSKTQEEICFMVSTLYGLNPNSEEENFGTTMGKVYLKTQSKSVERRFTILLDSKITFSYVGGTETGELRYRMRQNVKLAASKEVGVNWFELTKDLLGWTFESKDVQIRWARSFYDTIEPRQTVLDSERFLENNG
ncbi:MAG TPA: type I-E CRISPR-associated protein Cse2/CasB [Thermotogota bacterium]|nr:type I-E CRISPR-associated protein Cse2/CasB [Thermotogota bacterium]